jgi:hypothetical protein
MSDENPARVVFVDERPTVSVRAPVKLSHFLSHGPLLFVAKRTTAGTSLTGSQRSLKAVPPELDIHCIADNCATHGWQWPMRFERWYPALAGNDHAHCATARTGLR